MKGNKVLGNFHLAYLTWARQVLIVTVRLNYIRSTGSALLPITAR